jgi:hypothetical protein
MRCEKCGSTDVDMKMADWGICGNCGALVESEEIRQVRKNVARAFRKVGHPLPGDSRAGVDN